MPARPLNWIKFIGMLGLVFVLGLVFTNLLDLPRSSLAQGTTGTGMRVEPIAGVDAPSIPA